MLQQLNQITLAKYTDMCTIAHRLNEVSARVNDNCELVHYTCIIVVLHGHMHQGSGLHVACVDIKQTGVHLSYLHALAPVSEHLVSYYFVVWSIRKILDDWRPLLLLCYVSHHR